jgi:hypothetical protein
MTNRHKLYAPWNVAVAGLDLTPFDRIRLHLRCLIRDHKHCWHVAGMWRELRLR